MTISQQILISLLKKSLFNINTTIPDNVNWQEVFDEAVCQSVVPIAFDGTKGINNIPDKVYKNFKNYTISVILNNDKITNEQKKLISILKNNNVNYAVLKGLSVARFYNNPHLRTLGDIDFLVNAEDFEKTKELLINNAYALIENENNHFHCAFEKNGVVFEMHFQMSEFPKTQLCDDLASQLKKAVNCSVTVNCFDNQFKSLNLLYQAVSLLLHMERHISKDGLGLRQLLDWGFFIESNSGFLKKDEYCSFLKKYGLYRLACVCNDVVDKYFLDKEIDNPIADEMFDLVIKKGNFGVKRELEDTYYNGVVKNKEMSFIKKFFVFFNKRAELTWSLAQKYSALKYFGFIYIPIRHVLRVILRKNKMINYNKVLYSFNEINDFYKDLNIFKEEH